MGCVSSKKAVVSVTPAVEPSVVLRQGHLRGSEETSAASARRRGEVGSSQDKDEAEYRKEEADRGEPEESRKVVSSFASSRSLRLLNPRKCLQGEQVAAGWPPWLSAVAGEAIQGWIPLKADSFEKLEKVGQGTYSSVFRARNLDTGKIVALKKVRFDNFEPESVRFMAREIQILRRLDHPNVMKLEGLIASRMSCSLYLVFEYMEHDLAGLSSTPEIKFSESQVKCYMYQLLSGLEHCHSHGIIHRDIKGANLLVNNEGVLKIADFGLANVLNPEQNQPLTSRVVTLWYRPPELLLGSTNYNASVDLWSVGCVFAELFLGKPILQGRTEVEQLHRSFKLCGSPLDEYWKKSKLPHATIFKPHRPYESSLRESFKSMPESALSLLEIFLSIEPYKRGTASSALTSEYFKTKPYACDPSSLPKYPPNKEIDAKIREELHRRKVSTRGHGGDATRKPSRLQRASQDPDKPEHTEEMRTDSTEVKTAGMKHDLPRANGNTRLFTDLQPLPAIHQKDEVRHAKNDSEEDIAFSGPLIVSSSSGYAWAKQKEARPRVRSHDRWSSKSHLSGGSDQENKQPEGTPNSKEKTKDVHREPESAKRAVLKKWLRLERLDSFDSCDTYHSQDISDGIYRGDAASSKNGIPGCQDQGHRVESRALSCHSLIRSRNFYRNTSAISAKLLEYHGSKELLGERTRSGEGIWQSLGIPSTNTCNFFQPSSKMKLSASRRTVDAITSTHLKDKIN